MNFIAQDGKTLAIQGAAAAFGDMLCLGQHYFPEWSRYEAAFRDIFDRQYYTNHGPLAQRLEARAAQYLGVRHAMCITNEAIALCLAAQALGLQGKVLVPAMASVHVAQSLQWAGCQPVYCDVDAQTGMMDPQAARARVAQGDIAAILAANLFGGVADCVALQAVADEFGVVLYVDSSAAFGCSTAPQVLASAGRLQVFSLHSSHVLSATEGALIVTDDDQLAAHVRNIRSNYGMGTTIVPVVKTSNGRFSEAQAAVALANFDDLDAHIASNHRLREAYQDALEAIEGVTLLTPAGVTRSNGECVMLSVDQARYGLSGKQLISVLAAENIQATPQLHAGFYRSSADGDVSLPIADAWSERLVELPVGRAVNLAEVHKIADVIRAAHAQANALAAGTGEQG